MPKFLKKKIVVFPLLLIFACLLVFGWAKTQGFGDWSEGNRTGELIKYSTKGIIAKHGEGELLQNDFGLGRSNAGSNGGIKNGGNVFVFNVADKEVAEQMRQAQQLGQKVNVKYKQYLIAPWYFNGSYEAIGVTVVGEEEAQEP